MVLMPEWVARRAYLSPQAPALFFGGRTYTFAELNEEAERAACALRAALAEARARHPAESDALTTDAAGRPLRVGPRVAVLLPNSPDFVVVVHALAKAGAVLVPLNVRLAPGEMAWQVQDAEAALLIYDETYAEKAQAVASLLGEATPRLLDVAELRAAAGFQQVPDRGEAGAPPRTHVDLDEVHSILYTSGTTGRPKGALLTYGNHWWSAVGSALNLGLAAGDRWLACVPLFHVSGLSILFRSVLYGIPVVLHPRFDPEAVNRAIDEDGVTLLSVVAAMLDRMLDAKGGQRYPPSLRAVLLGGGPAPEALLRRAAAAGMPVLQTYGLTETASQAATLAPADALVRIGSAGKPLFPTEVRVVVEDEAGSRRWAAPGEAGEIVVRGPTVTVGYWRRPDATAEKFRDGWFHTGDVGFLDADGYLYVLDRRDDMFVSGGENVYPAEIEAVLREHAAVADAGVVGVPDATWGRVPAAAVVLRPGASATAEELALFCRQRLAGYKVPKQFAFVAALPRNAAGKLLRRELTGLFAGGTAP